MTAFPWMPRDQWYAVGDEYEEELLADWPEAPVENQRLFATLIEVARQQVIEFAPDAEPAEQVADLLGELGYSDTQIAEVLALLALTPATSVPTRLVYAQLQQAKNLWNAGRSSVDGEAGQDGFTFTPRPLDANIRGIIRPRSGVADVF